MVTFCGNGTAVSAPASVGVVMTAVSLPLRNVIVHEPKRDALKAGLAAQKFGFTAIGAHVIGPTVNPPCTAVRVDPVAGLMLAPSWLISPAPPILRSLTPRESRKLFTVFGVMVIGAAPIGVNKLTVNVTHPIRVRSERIMGRLREPQGRALRRMYYCPKNGPRRAVQRLRRLGGCFHFTWLRNRRDPSHFAL